MYLIEPATIKDWYALHNKATESMKPDYQSLNGSTMHRLIIDGQVVVLMGYKDMILPNDHGESVDCRVVAGLFRRDVDKYTKIVVRAGREYLKMIRGKPLVAIANESNPVYNRFLSFMGFKDTEELEKDAETDTMFKIYMRI